ncbi:unnamed protein product [marine sediment metagenome]|uniref:Uncharacterized protein n=1 Tax=marine sediment metagenome TaxID=412755 RepID=X0W9X5_9ZZZZ
MINYKTMKKSRIINALYAKAQADRQKALMSLDLLENQAVGIGDHTADDFFEDAEKSLQLLVDSDDKIATIDKYFETQKTPMIWK